MSVLWVAIGAFVGAPARYVVDRAVQGWHRSVVPWGTFAANMTACFVLGLVAGAVSAPGWLPALVGTGFCGSLSTFSTFGYEGVQLIRTRRATASVGYLAGSTVVGVLLVWLGWTITR